METATKNSVDRLQVLHGILSEATDEASAAMRTWTGGSISLSLDCVRELPLEQVTEEFGMGMEMLTMVVLTIGGEVGGTFILTFDEENGRRLASKTMPYFRI